MSVNRELPPEGGQHGHGMELADDGSSLMLCSPLIPHRDSLVEIAETEYVPLSEPGQIAAESYRSPLHQAHTVEDMDEEDGDERMDEMHRTSTDEGEGFSHTVEGDSAENDADTNGEETRPNPSGTESRSVFRWPWSKTEEEKRAVVKAKEEQKLKKNEKLVWVPSPTNISLQTMWWGYRMSVNFKQARSEERRVGKECW